MVKRVKRGWPCVGLLFTAAADYATTVNTVLLLPVGILRL